MKRVGPVSHGNHPSVVPNQPSRQAAPREPLHTTGSPHQCSGARDVRVNACRGSDARRPPHRRDRSAGRGIDDVVIDLPVLYPATRGRARRRQATGGDRHQLTVTVETVAVILGHINPPATLRSRAGGRDVTPQADQTAHPRRLVHGVRRAIGRPRFRGGAQIQAHAPGDTNGGGLSVDLDRLPSGRDARAYRRPLRLLGSTPGFPSNRQSRS